MEVSEEKPCESSAPENVYLTADAIATNADTSQSEADGLDEAQKREKRIAEATARCEAPIRPEFLVASLPPAERQPKSSDEQQNSSEKGVTVAEGEASKKREGTAEEKPPQKKRRGQNKAKERDGNMAAFRAVKQSQLCAKLAYANCCDSDKGGDDAPGQGCKFPHDIEAVLASKLPLIGDSCPVLQTWGVCPAGLNCRFGGHIIEGKNVDIKGNIVAPDSPWMEKIPGVGHPVGETNVFPYSLVKQLRSGSFDFTRSLEACKDWQRYQSKATDKPLGALADFEPKPLDFTGKSILAPLTTVGNLPFRRLCVKLGVDVTVGEMALSSSILQGGPSDLSLLRRHESEKCFGVQVAGGDVETMAKLAQFVDEKVDCDFVDINCGCPLDEIHRKGAGSALMSKRNKLEGIVRCMSSVLKTKPLTLKMRTAHFEDSKSKEKEFQGRIAHQLIPQLEEWGVSALCLHGRTARQRYTKLADWDYINECSTRRVRRTPLIGCGDVLSWEEAEEHRKSHGVDAIMMGRGALIKPWLFTEIKEKRHWDISASERFDLMKDFVNYGLEHWGSDARGVENTRRFLLEWLSFTCRYVPIGLLEAMPPKINWRPRPYFGRNDLETKLASTSASDWVAISEMLLGKVPDGFNFIPKHKSNSYEKPGEATAPSEQG